MIRFTTVLLSLTALFSSANASDVKILSPNVQDMEVQKMIIIHADPVFEKTDLSSSANNSNDVDVVGHYGPPPSCDADEQMFQIQGVPGKVCQVPTAQAQSSLLREIGLLCLSLNALTLASR